MISKTLFRSNYTYFNGNYIVNGRYHDKFFKLEKRALRIGEEFNSKFPDSIDLKITNKCSHGCPFCHESSTKDGKSFDLEKTKLILSQLPSEPIEVAIGGGNVVECLDELKDLCAWLIERNNRPRITINVKDIIGPWDDPKIRDICNFVSNNIEGIGISLESLDFLDNITPIYEQYMRSSLVSEYVNSCPTTGKIPYESCNDILGKLLTPDNKYELNSVVYHIIAGIFPVSQLKRLISMLEQNEGLLILGYKQWGRAKDSELPDMTEWKKELQDILSESRRFYIGFDNLACEQLSIKDIVKKDIWDEIYMGDEGSCSMYIDAVKGEFARTSRSPERVSWDNIKLLDYYASLH